MMFAVAWLIFIGGIAGKLFTVDGTRSHVQDAKPPTLKAVAGVRAFMPKDGLEPLFDGGEEAWPNSWPWHVVLFFGNTPSCSGAILNRYWIVTASHCFKGSVKGMRWTVKAGKHDLGIKTEACQQNVKVAKIITHKDYNHINRQHDIALVKLQTPLIFDECVRPISLWSRDVPLPKRCTVTGWGSTVEEGGPHVNWLQEANVTILESDTCVGLYGGVIHSSMVCAREVTGDPETCRGDSGSPLSCFTGDWYEVAAIMSRAMGCGHALKPGVFTRLASYIQWIKSLIDGQLGIGGVWKTPAVCGQAKEKPCGLDKGYVGCELSGSSGELTVVNVTEACPHSWPWQVSLQNEAYHYCSGTLINERWVLTARHCSVEIGDWVVLGTHDLNSLESQHASVKAVYSEPHDGSYPPVHDLALIYLSVPAQLGSSISPVCVPDEDLQFDESSSCVTTGWGFKRSTPNLSPDILHQAHVKTLSDQACWSGWGQFFSSSAFLCTQPAASSSCLGDAGAPLLCQKNGRYYLTGMMALGLKHCDQQKPAIFTSVSSFWSWIEKTMALKH